MRINKSEDNDEDLVYLVQLFPQSLLYYILVLVELIIMMKKTCT